MAKRKRLTPIATLTDAAPPPLTQRAPIADVARDASASAALTELAQEMETARAEGRMILELPVADIDAGHLLRDRMGTGEEEMAALIASIRARGQQVPVEVTDLGPDQGGPRYGLISGWRRLQAITQLRAEGAGGFDTIRAVLRAPARAADAYLAMVEENEIRVGLSYYERARVAARAAEAGVFADTAEAIRQLFAAGSKAKRSKIGSFVRIYETLDDVLSWPAALPERLGLRLSQALAAGQGDRIRRVLRQAEARDADAEQAALTQALRAEAAAKTKPAPVPDVVREVVPGIRLARSRGKLVLSGPGVNAALETALTLWLAQQS
ncbi:MAG: ParB N-terminal domain-containing protein [Pseudomonadota bacterium]